jgi:hypothetical protein
MMHLSQILQQAAFRAGVRTDRRFGPCLIVNGTTIDASPDQTVPPSYGRPFGPHAKARVQRAFWRGWKADGAGFSASFAFGSGVA